MKKFTVLAFALILMFSINAQITTPQPSPYTKIEQKVGLTDVTLEYSRPGMRERTIFGDLVPYGKMWRTGANKNTMISFSDDVVVDGQTLKAGSYAIFVTPNESNWDVVFYTDTENWGTPAKWDAAKVAAKTTVETMKLPMMVETFTITFDNLSNNSAEIGFIWADTMANIKFEVPTDASVLKAIKKTMAGPTKATLSVVLITISQQYSKAHSSNIQFNFWRPKPKTTFLHWEMSASHYFQMVTKCFLITPSLGQGLVRALTKLTAPFIIYIYGFLGKWAWSASHFCYPSR